jgi:hypothetical protein
MRKEYEDKFRVLGGIAPVGGKISPLSEDELSAIERDLQATLPPDYRRYLREYGLAAFGEYVNFRPLCPLPPHISDNGAGHLSYFYGAGDGAHSLRWNIEILRDRMPNTIIPIGDDGVGNQICIGIAGNERGKVYFWDHENEWDEADYLEEEGVPMPPEVKFQNVYLVAESFADFINRLEVAKDV